MGAGLKRVGAVCRRRPGCALLRRGSDLPGFCPAVYPACIEQLDCIPRTSRPHGAGTLDAAAKNASHVPTFIVDVYRGNEGVALHFEGALRMRAGLLWCNPECRNLAY